MSYKYLIYILVLVACAQRLSAQNYRVEIYAIGHACNPRQGNSSLDVNVSLNGRNGGHTFNSFTASTVKIFDETFTSTPVNPFHIGARSVCQDCPDGRDSCELFTDTESNDQTIDFSGNTACSTISIPIPIEYASLRIELKWTPIYEPPTSNSITQSGTDLCEGDNLTLSTGAGYSNYVWQYKDSSTPSFQSFYTNPGTGSGITFGIDKIYGPSYQDKLGTDNALQFQYGLGSCPKVTTNDPVRFFPKAPQVLPENTGFTVTNPQCYGGNGSVIITDVNRGILPGETLRVSIFESSADVINGIPIPDGQNSNVTTFPIAFNNIAPGNYKFFVESIDYQCGDALNPLVTNFTIAAPTQVTFGATPTQPLCYGGSNGSINVTGGGGTGSYTYSKDNGSNYQSPNTFSGLTAGDYQIKIKDSNNCLSATTTVTVTQPPDINVSTPAVTSNYNGSDISCVGNSDGQITVTVSGGTPTLMYSRDGTNYQSSNIFNALGAGSYIITVKDGNDCTKESEPVPIEAPPAIAATLTPTTTSCNGSSDGEILVTSPAGGTGSLEYSINGTTYQPATLFTGLIANNYTITVRDANLCTATFNTTVAQPAAIGISSTPTLVTCAGGNDGMVQITATHTAGTPVYSLNGGTFQASNTFTGLSANTYSITVRDGNGCTGTGNVTINANPVITGNITVSTPISCNGGSDGALNLTPGGGVGPYTFQWSNGSTSEDISNLSANTYTVTITDSKNCGQAFSRVLAQPLPITVNATLSDFNGSNVSCFGGNNGAINLTPAGGNGGYAYSWSNGATTQNISGLTAGTYTVTVTDSKSCTGNESIIINQPAQLITTIGNTQHISCFGEDTGSITLNTTGGTTGYEYSINGGSSWQSSSTFTNLVAAAYTLLTRDANGCADSDGTTLTSPADIILTIDDVANTTCNQNNGSIQASATGGVSNYTFNWFNSGNTQIGTGNSINNLAAGVYRIEVIDQNSCSKQQNVTISSSDGPSVTVQSVTAASCSNTADGSATISITQGESPYSILWPNNQTTATATNLAGGDYIVEVRDNTNCLALQTVTVPAPAPLIIQTITEQDPNCFGNADGEIEVLAQGGNGGYAYNWSTGAAGTLLTNLPAGTYTLTTTDSKNCEAVETFTLIDPPVFSIELGEDEKICEGQTVIKQSEVDNAVYAWTGPDNFSSDQQQVSLSLPGVYTLTVINQNGCEASDSFTLSFDTDLLKADFLMVSEAFAGDTIIVIDISWPVPTTVAWQFDAAAVVLDRSQDFSLIRFDEPGDYTISMLAQLATCASSHSQSISILENTDDGSGGRISSEKIIHALTIYPNPTTDKLDVTIELNKAHRAVLEIYHLHSNRKELSEIFDGDTLYESDLSLAHLQSGLYVVVVKAGKEIKSMKLIKL